MPKTPEAANMPGNTAQPVAGVIVSHGHLAGELLAAAEMIVRFGIECQIAAAARCL